MPKVITIQNKYGIKFPYQEGHLLRIQESEEEPVRKYLWKTPGGYTFVYCDGDWKLLQKYIRDCGCDKPKESNESISKEDFEALKQQLLEYLNLNGQIPEGLEQRLVDLENREDHDTVYDDTALREWVRQLANSGQTGLGYDDSALWEAVQQLINKEDHDTIYNDTELRNIIQGLQSEHGDFLTAEYI